MRDTPEDENDLNFDVVSHLDQTGFSLPGPNYNNESRLYRSEPSP